MLLLGGINGQGIPQPLLAPGGGEEEGAETC